MPHFNGVDWLIVAVLAWGAFAGFRRGFVGLVADIGGTVLAFYLAAHYAGAAVQYLDRHLGLIKATAGALEQRLPISQALASLPVSALGGPALRDPARLYADAVAQIGLPPFLQEYLARGAAELRGPASGVQGGNLGQFILHQLALLLWTGIVFTFGALLVRWLINWAGKRAGDVLGNVGLSLPNRMVGAVLGVAEKGFYLAVLLSAVLPVLNLWASIPALGESWLAPRLVAIFSGLLRALL